MNASIRLRRRSVLAGLGGLVAAPAIVHGQGTYPNKPVRWINPFPAGGATDTLSRLFCAKMAEITGQQWLVENKGGSGGNVGMDTLAQAAPDGYTLGLGGIASHAIAPTLYARLPFNARTDFTFVSTIYQLPNMLVVNLELPVKTVAELIDLLRKNPGKYSYASAGNGTTLHLSGELFKTLAGVDIVHVPYKGTTTAVPDLMTGRVSMMFDGGALLPQAREGKVRMLAVTSARRLASMPDLPTMAESGVPGYEMDFWFGIVAPAGTPAPIVERLSQEIAEVERQPAFRARLAPFNQIQYDTTTPAAMSDVLRRDLALWAKLLRDYKVEAQ